MKVKRIEIVDVLRGLAALVVVWFHVTNTYPEDSLVRASGSLGWLGVEVFFVISGFVISYSMYRVNYKLSNDWKTFLVKRLLRLEPPYFAAIFLALVLWYVSSLTPGFQGEPFEISIIQLGFHVGYLVDIFDYSWFNPVFWTLALEFQFYFIILFMFPLIFHKTYLIRTFFFIVLVFSPLLISSSIFVFDFLGLFLLGVLAFQHRSKNVPSIEIILLTIIISIFLYHNLGMKIMVVGLFTASLIAFVNVRPWKLFLYFGTISYSLYLVHVPIGGRVVNIGKRWASTELEFMIISMIAVLASIVVAHLFYRYIENPARSWSSRISYKKNE